MTETTTSTDLAPVSDNLTGDAVAKAIEGLNTGKGIFSTLQGTDRAAKLKTLSALTDSVPLKDHKNKTIFVEDVLIQSIEMPDENTGELTAVPRIVLIDTEGVAYHAISGGLMKSLENIFGIMGPKEGWGGPIPLRMEEGKAAKGTFFTAKVVLDELPSK